MKLLTLSLIFASVLIAQKPPSQQSASGSTLTKNLPVATKAIGPSPFVLSESEISKLEALQARRAALRAQEQTIQTMQQMLAVETMAYESKVKAAHPDNAVHLDPKELVWQIDPPPSPATPAKVAK